jgi:3-methyladenine DNA glycosylase AlkD
MATFCFIRRHDFNDALALSEMLLNDSQDLIHKAVGWIKSPISLKLSENGWPNHFASPF